MNFESSVCELVVECHWCVPCYNAQIQKIANMNSYIGLVKWNNYIGLVKWDMKL